MLPVSQLAGVLSRTSHNVTYLAGRLAKQGLVTRRRSRFGDRRTVLVRITEEGSAKVRVFRARTVERFALEDDDAAQRLDRAIAVLMELVPNGRDR